MGSLYHPEIFGSGRWISQYFSNKQNKIALPEVNLYAMSVDLEVLLKYAKSRSYPRRSYLIKEGELKKDIFYITKGLVRGFRINDNGDEVTTGIRWENQFIVSRDALILNQPSQFSCIALEPTEVLLIDYEELIAREPKLEALIKFVYQIIEQPLLRLDSFLMQNPQERYLSFVKSYPDILDRLPDKYLSNVIGITPVSLSRIRKRLSSKK